MFYIYILYLIHWSKTEVPEFSFIDWALKFFIYLKIIMLYMNKFKSSLTCLLPFSLHIFLPRCVIIYGTARWRISYLLMT